MARQRRMRAKPANVQSNATHHPLSASPVGGVRYAVALEQRRSRLLAPRLGDGVRLCGAVLLSRSPLNPVCRFAQDDTWVTGTRDGKQNAVSDSFTELYFQPRKLRTTFRLTHRVILSEAAPPAKNHARPPIIAAQRTPPQAGRRQAGSPLLNAPRHAHSQPGCERTTVKQSHLSPPPIFFGKKFLMNKYYYIINLFDSIDRLFLNTYSTPAYFLSKISFVII